MPPPPRPCARSRVSEHAASNEKTSPYFSEGIRDLCTTATRGEKDRTSQFRNKRKTRGYLRPSEETISSSPHHESAWSAQGPTTKLTTPPIQLLFEQSVQSVESVGMDVVRSDIEIMPTEECRESSFSDDEEEKRIRAEASMEKRGFRSAKSLERSIVKRRNLKG